MVSKKQLNKLKIILKESRNLDLSDEEVSRIGNAIIARVCSNLKTAVENMTEQNKEDLMRLKPLIEQAKFIDRLDLNKKISP